MALSEDMKARIQKWDERDAAMLRQLTRPVLQDEYPGRHIEPHTVKSITTYPNGGSNLSTNESSGCVVPADLVELLPEGKLFGLEIRGGSQITGWLIDGKWYHRKSDDELQVEHEKWLAEAKRKHRDEYEANKAKYDQWAAELPEWVDPKGDFKNPSDEWVNEFMGFAYSLVAARLAVLYADMGPVILKHDSFSIGKVESDEVKAFHRENGTSGNQAGWALAVAKNHLETEGAS